jgi:hypothetical protein
MFPSLLYLRKISRKYWRIVEMADTTQSRPITWNNTLEHYFKEVGEKANCLSWCHKRAEEYFSAKTVIIDLPCIIIGSINGFISVGAKQIFPGDDMSSLYIGVVALFVSLLNTISSYFSWGRRAEAHKMSALNYAKLYRFLSVEMSLPREERMACPDLLKYTKAEYDRLSEISPLLPAGVIDTFKSRFSKLSNISFPEETNGLHPLAIYKPSPAEPVPTSPPPTDSPTLVLREPDSQV